LNTGTPQAVPVDFMAALEQQFRAVRRMAFTPDGRVDYRALRDSSAYADYRDLVPGLAVFDPSQLTATAQAAFWINLYNMLTVDIVVQAGLTNIVDVPHAFWEPGYIVGGHFYSLHDVEQGILRANAGYPGLPGPQFRVGDPRAALALPTLDPRIHFALVCAAVSCPPIALYDADHLDAQLDLAARNFVNSPEVQINLDRQTAHLSKIFQWYALDFGAGFLVSAGYGHPAPILRWIAPHLTDADAQQTLAANANRFRVRFNDYDWRLNDGQAKPLAVVG